MSASPSPRPRGCDLDWLRVLLILTVFVFHLTRFFDNDSWHVKNGVTYPAVNVVIAFIGSWLMPMIFVVSGASLFLTMGKGDARGSGTRSGAGASKFAAFFKVKAMRLLVPLIAGIFTHVMFQVYLEKVTHHQFIGSFWRFIPVYPRGWYGFGGNFAWMGLHLWYLLMLFVFALAAYPPFLLLRGPARLALNGFTRFLALPGAMYLLAIPTILTVLLISPQSPLGRRDWGGWSLVAHFWFFFAGFVIGSRPSRSAMTPSMRAGKACQSNAGPCTQRPASSRTRSPRSSRSRKNSLVKRAWPSVRANSSPRNASSRPLGSASISASPKRRPFSALVSPRSIKTSP